MSTRKKRAFKDGIFKITFSRGTPSEAVMTAAIGLFLKEIGLSTKHLESLGYGQGEIQVEVLRILLKDAEEAYGLSEQAKTQ
ncbi:MAG TPA: hypothetical protein VIK38_00165 [Coriobacteriia bacterium]